MNPHAWKTLPWLVMSVVSLCAAEHTWTPARDLARDTKLAAVIPPTVEFSELRALQGDDARWAQQDWDDTGWRIVDFRGLPAHAGIFWLRLRVRDTRASVPDALYLNFPMAYEFYWDGVVIGRSGRPANTRVEEVSGNSLNLLAIPADLRGPGEHVIAARVSNLRDRFPSKLGPMQVFPGSAAAWRVFNAHAAILPDMAVGAMLMITLTGFVMWLLAARLPVLLIFTALCLCATTMQGLAMAFWDYGFSYEWNYSMTLARGFAIDGMGLCLLALAIVMFGLPRWMWLALVVLPAAGVPLHWFGISMNRPLLTVALVLVLSAAAWAIWRRRRGAWLVLVGLLVTTVLWLHDPVHFVLADFFQGFLPTMLGLTSAIALQVREARRKARDVQLTAARMELELLKKNLQPHFLLNTLATLIEIIEQEPKTAVTLIEALAKEFRILARVAGEKLIPLGHELELCRAHLRVMGIRNGVRCSLEVAAGVEETDLVPPALFHTLVENGLTHLWPRDGEQRFELRAAREASRTRYTFIACGEPSGQERPPTFAPLQSAAALVAAQPAVRREGTGLRYIKARLEESFPGRWTLRGELIDGGWQTVIEIDQVKVGRRFT